VSVVVQVMEKPAASARVVLVIVVARGIGRAIATSMARQGGHVVLIDVLPAAREATRTLKERGYSATGLRFPPGPRSHAGGAAGIEVRQLGAIQRAERH
jgi:NAD(P)-dependent dehydrogenase (short-subunit alcohol dehydrogenase family)